MSTESPIARINKRRTEIKSRVEVLRAEIDNLVAEEGELDAAERVFLRLFPDEATSPRNVESGIFDLEEDDETEAMSVGTVPEMIVSVVKDAYGESQRGITGSEIFSTIRKRWKPDIKSDSVRPVIWRLAKSKRILQQGRLYYPSKEKRLDLLEKN